MRGRHGVALVLVLWLIVLLGGIAGSVLAETRTSTRLAANARARVSARYAAESGIEATRAELEAVLRGEVDTLRLAAALNALPSEPRGQVTLGEDRFQVAIVDPGSRLDVNAAPVRSLAALFAHFTDIGRAEATARAIRASIERGSLTGEPTVVPIRSLEELRALPGVDGEAVARAAPYLTVDGDGTVNVATAPAIVRQVAFGELRQSPSRLLIVSRGWRDGHPLTHEIQALFARSGSNLVLVSWRERLR
jgi:general secretion pathway protein K